MKIFFLNGQYPFCYYYRGYLPAVYSGQTFVNDFIQTGHSLSAEELTNKALDADVIVFQRPNRKEMYDLMTFLKKRGKKVLFENDDTYLEGIGIKLERLDSDKARERAKELSGWTNKCLSIADGAIASTEFLADEYRKVNKNTVVLKNCIDPLDEFPVKKNETGKFRVGFIGSVTTNDDYIHIKDAIRALDERGDVTLVVHGIKYKDGSTLDFMRSDKEFWDSLKNVEYHPYVPVNEYMSTLASLSLDLVVIPREDSYFNRAKSNLKFLEASLLGIPVLAQGFADGKAPYQKDSGYCTIVVDNSTWKERLIDIQLNHYKYKKLALKARDYVLREYNIESYADVWVQKIRELIT